MANKYVTLWTLIEEWSKQSGELPQVVLTNLCDYDRRRGFPADTFNYRSLGYGSCPGELYGLVERKRSSKYKFIRDDSAKTLKDVVADKIAILSYCREHSVRPPRSLLGYWSWLFWKKSQFTAPPRYPATSEEVAAHRAELEAEELFAKDQADRLVESQARQALSRLNALVISKLEHPEIWKDRPDNLWVGLAERGDEEIACAEAYIEQISDDQRAAELRKELAESVTKLEALKSKDRDDRRHLSEGDTGNSGQAAGQMARSTAAAECKARTHLEEQVLAGNWLSKADHLALARNRVSEDLSERAFDRIWADVAPQEWKQPGRRRKP